MSSNNNSNINKSTEYKNPFILESTEKFYKIFKKISLNKSVYDEALFMELLEIDFECEENFRFAIFLVLQNFNKIWESYINPSRSNFKAILDQFISKSKFANFIEMGFLKSLIGKENAKLLDSKNFKTTFNLQNEINSSFGHINNFNERLVSYDNEYRITNKNVSNSNANAKETINFSSKF